MEIKAHKFAQSKDYQDYFKVISEFPEIVCSETHQYLLLHASDFLKNNHDDLSKQYLKAACIVNYCLELGKDGTALFFARYYFNFFLFFFFYLFLFNFNLI